MIVAIPAYADRLEMQNRLFAELSTMFGKEVPLYDKSLAVNAATNSVVCDFLAEMHDGFSVSNEQVEKTSGERHGAIRIGRPDEYRWIGRFFACFAMEPHNFYDMTSVGAKSQPVIASAFRSSLDPQHRVFASLLVTDYFDDETKHRIDALLATREVFSDEAKRLIEKAETQGGLDWADAEALIREGVERIFKWTGEARDFALYEELCESGFKIASDIACFGAHHLNHLTPNTFCMDLYTSAMKFCMGEIDEPSFRRRATLAVKRLARDADEDWLRLHFKHFSREEIDSFARREVTGSSIERRVDGLVEKLRDPAYDLTSFEHDGFKDATEGPPAGTPVLLRQDAYRALTEPVRFTNPDGTEIETTHTARFGEIEQRFYATTPEGRSLYDACLEKAEAIKAEDPEFLSRDPEAYDACFEAFPKRLDELLEAGLVYGLYKPTDKGLDNAGAIEATDIHALVREGYVAREGLRYEDFLPVSAAGIFASNLGEYGTASTARRKPTCTRETLESILERSIVDTDVVYRGRQAASLLDTYEALGLLARVDNETRSSLEAERDALPEAVTERFGTHGFAHGRA